MAKKTNNKDRFAKTVNIKNRRASYEFSFIDKYIVGMVLKGSEIKSIRESKVNLQDAHCVIFNNELFIRNMHISPFSHGTIENHDENRERKLLLKKKDILKIGSKLEEKGLTLIPLRLFITDRGFAKMEIALSKGKKVHDKRGDIKEKDLKREMDRIKF